MQLGTNALSMIKMMVTMMVIMMRRIAMMVGIKMMPRMMIMVVRFFFCFSPLAPSRHHIF